MFKKAALTIILVATFNFCVSAHKFYTSLTQIEYKAETQSAEVIINLFSDDLELALSNQNKRKIKSTDPDFQALTYTYLNAKFRLKNAKNQFFKNEYVGLELKRDIVSIYLEIKLSADFDNFSLKQISLLETNKEQINIVNLKSGKARTTLIFTAGKPDIQPIAITL